MAVADHDKISPPAEAEDFPLCFDQVNVCRGGTQADGGGLEQVPGGGREAPVAVAPLVFQLVESGEGSVSARARWAAMRSFGSAM